VGHVRRNRRRKEYTDEIGANTKSTGKDRVHVISRAGLIVLVVLSTGGGTWADQDLIKPGEETFRVKLGGIINESNTSLRLDGSSGRSREVNLEDAGLEKDSAGFLGEATWRFAANHRIGIQTFAIQRSGTKTTAQDIQLGDNVVPAGTTLSAESKSRFLIADYEYSFVKNDRLELAGLVGLYGARFKFNFNATSPVTNVDRSLLGRLRRPERRGPRDDQTRDQRRKGQDGLRRARMSERVTLRRRRSLSRPA
jgi:hypothetical protein